MGFSQTHYTCPIKRTETMMTIMINRREEFRQKDTSNY